MSVEEYNIALAAGGNSNASEPEIVKIELADITERKTWGDRSIITRTGELHKAKQENERYREYALVLRRVVDREGNPKSTCLEARSKIIRDGLKKVLRDYSSVNMESIPIVIPKPYAPLFHYRKELRDYASDESRREEDKSHIQVLIQFMDKNLQEIERAYDRLLPSEMISYDILWTIFRPEDIIIARRDHFVESYMVDSYTISEGKDDEMVLTIVGRSWDYNGVRFGPVTTELKLHGFVGNKKIEALEVYPISFHRQRDVEEKLIKRGFEWRKVIDVTHKEYHGELALKPERARIIYALLTYNSVALAWTDPMTKDAKNFQELIPMHV
jgi:hypothetical protein